MFFSMSHIVKYLAIFLFIYPMACCHLTCIMPPDLGVSLFVPRAGVVVVFDNVASLCIQHLIYYVSHISLFELVVLASFWLPCPPLLDPLHLGGSWVFLGFLGCCCTGLSLIFLCSRCSKGFSTFWSAPHFSTLPFTTGLLEHGGTLPSRGER